MKRYLVGRLVWSIVAVWGVVTLVFVILRLSGDPAAVLLSPQGTKEEYAALRRALGLDLPLPVQYGLFSYAALRAISAARSSSGCRRWAWFWSGFLPPYL